MKEDLPTTVAAAVSNTFVTAGQYKLIERAPNGTDREMLKVLQKHLENKPLHAVPPSLVDPFLTTLTNKPEVRDAVHRHMWSRVLKTFDHECVEAPLHKGLAKKVTIQVQNSLRRISKEVRPSDPIEIRVADATARLRKCKSIPDLFESLMAARKIRNVPHAFVREHLDDLVNKILNKYNEKLWDHALQHEFTISKPLTMDLYEPQKRFVESIRGNGGGFIELATPPNSGKTFLAGALPSFSKKRIIFCCTIPSVYLHVARLWYFTGAWPTFVYGQRKVEPNFKISRETWDPSKPKTFSQYLSTTLKDARVFVVDLNLCRWFMDSLNDPTAILFIDEVTVGLDGCSAFAQAPRMLCDTLKSSKLPSTVILSSATLPAAKYLDGFFEKFHQLHPDAPRIRIDTPVLTSSISLVDSTTGKVLVPHDFVDEVDPTDPVWLKAYSGPVVAAMRKSTKITFEEAGIPVSLESFCLKSIRKYAWFLLDHGVRPSLKDSTALFPVLDITTLATTMSHHLPGQTLIVSLNPSDVAQRIMAPLIKDRRLKSLEGVLASQKAREEAVAALEDKIKNPEERAEFVAAQEHTPGASFVPPEDIIHSSEHLRKYGGSLKGFPSSFIRGQPTPWHVRRLLRATATEAEKHMLLAGCVYLDRRMLTDSTSEIMDLYESAVDEKVPIVSVDALFTYGRNSPASAVVIPDEFAKTASRNTIIQFLNRVCRSSSNAHNGKAFLGPIAIAKIFAKDDEMEGKRLAALIKE